ncbi:rRNA maturation endonuclease Nob1 [Halarchaeum rubridurum]|nr:rubrerythrin-like domain-containing protein [Halarchaeum rubridurum]MBP1953547.1 rRNA maturation endonuclease Nob1 [Halarchaeum rubridurum]
MRPSVETKDSETYECVHCGARVVAPETRVCESCGGSLQSLSRSRDL